MRAHTTTMTTMTMRRVVTAEAVVYCWKMSIQYGDEDEDESDDDDDDDDEDHTER